MAYTISQIKQENAAAGFYYFSPDTMRFFKSKVLPRVYEGPGGVFFVTSEQPPHGSRVYSVRRFDPQTAKVESVGRADWLRTEADARDAARALARVGARQGPGGPNWGPGSIDGLLIDETPPDVGPSGADYAGIGDYGFGKLPEFPNLRAVERAIDDDRCNDAFRDLTVLVENIGNTKLTGADEGKINEIFDYFGGSCVRPPHRATQRPGMRGFGLSERLGDVQSEFKSRRLLPRPKRRR